MTSYPVLIEGPGPQPDTLIQQLRNEICWNPVLLYQTLALDFGEPRLLIPKHPVQIPAETSTPGLPARQRRSVNLAGRFVLHIAASAWSFALDGTPIAGRGLPAELLELIRGIEGQKVVSAELPTSGPSLILTFDLGGVLTAHSDSPAENIFGESWTLLCPGHLAVSRAPGPQGALTVSRSDQPHP